MGNNEKLEEKLKGLRDCETINDPMRWWRDDDNYEGIGE